VAAAAALVAAVMLVTHASALSITTAAITFPGVTLDGTDQTVNDNTSAAWRADATGESGGWNVTVASTDFDNGAGKTIAVSNFETRLLDANIAYISGIDTINIPVSTQTTFASLSGSALKIASAASGEGDGVYDMTPDFRLTVPAETYTGSYTATVTVAINAGP
jgi:hypothetical protein